MSVLKCLAFENLIGGVEARDGAGRLLDVEAGAGAGRLLDVEAGAGRLLDIEFGVCRK